MRVSGLSGLELKHAKFGCPNKLCLRPTHLQLWHLWGLGTRNVDYSLGHSGLRMSILNKVIWTSDFASNKRDLRTLLTSLSEL